MALTSNGSTTNSGGAVSSLSLTFDNALTAEDFYLFEVGLITTSAGGTVDLYINSDTTDANYSAGFIESDGTQSAANRAVRATPDAAGNITIIKGACALLGGVPFILAQTIDGGSTERATLQGVLNGSESTFTGLTLSASASIIADGSYIKCWPVSDLATVADVSVSGGDVQTLDTGAFTALSEGAAYLLFISGIRGATGGTAPMNIFINGDTTAGNYRRGFLDSGGNSGDSSATYGPNPRATGDVGFAFGFCGVHDSTPYLRVFQFSENTGASPSVYAIDFSLRHASETDFDQLQITGSTATAIGNDSRILIKEFSA